MSATTIKFSALLTGRFLLLFWGFTLIAGFGCQAKKSPSDQTSQVQEVNSQGDETTPEQPVAQADSDTPQPEPGDSSPRIPGFITENSRKDVLRQQFMFEEEGEPSPMVQTPSGLKYRILDPGTGKQMVAGAKFTVNFLGNLEDGTNFKKFLTAGRIGDIPEVMMVPMINNFEEVVPAWQEALPFLKEGGLIELDVPSELGFGEKGSDGVPPHSRLFYLIRLLTVDPVLHDELARRAIRNESFEKTKSGTYYKVHQQGEGRKAGFSDVVTFDYIVKRIDGTQYINTYETGVPRKESVVKLVRGLAEGVKMISEGGKVELILPPNLAFGRHSQTDEIPDNTFVRITLELRKVEPNPNVKLPKRKVPLPETPSSDSTPDKNSSSPTTEQPAVNSESTNPEPVNPEAESVNSGTPKAEAIPSVPAEESAK